MESTVLERLSTVPVLQKLDMSIKGSTVNQKVFAFLLVLLNKAPRTLPSLTVFFLIPKKPKLISDTINLLVPETAG